MTGLIEFFHDGDMVAIKSEHTGQGQPGQFAHELLQHGPGIADVAQVNGQVIGADGRLLQEQGFLFGGADRFQMQRAVVFHGNNEDEGRLGSTLQYLQGLVGNRPVTGIGAAAVFRRKFRNIQKIIKAEQRINGIAGVKAGGIGVDADGPVALGLESPGDAGQGPTRQKAVRLKLMNTERSR